MSVPRPRIIVAAAALLVCLSSLPRAAAARGPGRIRAKAVLVVSFDGRRVLYGRNAGQVRSIASISKLMASLVIMDHRLPLDGITTISAVDVKVGSGGCRTRLLRGMKLRNRDLLHAALLASDNRAISAMGRAVGLTPRKLVAAMNARARKMGLVRTRFMDPVGINHGNVSTAYEVAKILRQAVLNPVLQRVMRTRDYFFRPIWPRRRAINYHNTNSLVHRLRFPVYGGKTGFNNKAGYCFTSAMRLPGAGPVLVVVLGSTSKTQRFSDFFSVLAHLRRLGKVHATRRVAHRGRGRRGRPALRRHRGITRRRHRSRRLGIRRGRSRRRLSRRRLSRRRLSRQRRGSHGRISRQRPRRRPPHLYAEDGD